VLPGSKQGIHDQRWWDSHGLSAVLATALEQEETSSSTSGSSTSGSSSTSTSLLYPNPSLDRIPAAARDRYAAYDLVSPGVKRYNVWWASHEVVYPPPRNLGGGVAGGGNGGGRRGGGGGDKEAAVALLPPSAAAAASSPSTTPPPASASAPRNGNRNVAVASAAVSSSALSQAEGGAVLAEAAREQRERAAATKASTSSSGCPKGSLLWPSSEKRRLALNASRFHCYDAKQDAILQGYLALDAAHGIQSYATVWKAPAAARHPRCAGFDNSGGASGEKTSSPSPSQPPSAREFGGCAPNWDPQAMADFADFIAYLADRHRLSGGGFAAKQQQRKTTASPSSSGNGAGGGFAGFIIWNEAASALWFDTSPWIAPATGLLKNGTQAERWVDAYANLLETAERSLKVVAARPALVLASLDTLWASPGEKGPLYSPSSSNSSSSLSFPLGGIHAGRAHLGSGNLVEGLWRRLGTKVDWSLVRLLSRF